MNRKARRAQAAKDRRAAWKAHRAETWEQKRARMLSEAHPPAGSVAERAKALIELLSNPGRPIENVGAYMERKGLTSGLLEAAMTTGVHRLDMEGLGPRQKLDLAYELIDSGALTELDMPEGVTLKDLIWQLKGAIGPDTRPLARDTDVWDILGIPYQMPDGQWRAAFAHGHSVPVTEDERDELRRRHGVSW